MSKPRLTYFDFPASRGEECRIALHVAGVDFDDVRIKRDDWPVHKGSTPFGAMPVLEIAGRRPVAHSNVILALVGRAHGLHPKDPHDAAVHEAMMAHAEDLRLKVGPTIFMQDEAAKKAAREQLVASYFPSWTEQAERQVGEGPFFAGEELHVVDVKLFIVLRWFLSGSVDHIPPSVFDGAPKLRRLHDAVRDHERVRAWHEPKS